MKKNIGRTLLFGLQLNLVTLLKLTLWQPKDKKYVQSAVRHFPVLLEGVGVARCPIFFR